MEANPLISIVIPVYNVEPYLPKCIDSVLLQTYQNLEIILVDDGSTDQSPSICDAYALKDSRVYVIHQVNGGLSHARNVGTKSASGVYLAYLDSDDFWELDSALEEMVQIIQERSPDVLLFGFRKINLKTNNVTEFSVALLPDVAQIDRLKQELLQQRKYSNSAWCKLIRKRFLIEHNLTFPCGRKSEDLIWSRKLFSEAKSISFYPKSVMVYQTGRDGSITNTFSLKHLNDLSEQLAQDLHEIQLHKDAIYRKIGYSFWAQELCWILAYPAMLGKEQFHQAVSTFQPYLFVMQYGRSKRVIIVRWMIACLGLRCTMKVLNLFLRKKRIIGRA